MTAADHANTVRDRILKRGDFLSEKEALAALDALQTQAETAEAALDREAGTQDALDAMRAERDRLLEAAAIADKLQLGWHKPYMDEMSRRQDAEAERDHARDALRQIVTFSEERLADGHPGLLDMHLVNDKARAALGDKP